MASNGHQGDCASRSILSLDKQRQSANVNISVQALIQDVVEAQEYGV